MPLDAFVSVGARGPIANAIRCSIGTRSVVLQRDLVLVERKHLLIRMVMAAGVHIWQPFLAANHRVASPDQVYTAILGICSASLGSALFS